MEQSPAVSDAFQHVCGRALNCTSPWIDPPRFMVPSIPILLSLEHVRRQSVECFTELCVPRLPGCLRRPSLSHSRTCELGVLDRASPRRLQHSFVAPSPAALQSGRHVRRAAPNTADSPDQRECMTLRIPGLKTHGCIPNTQTIAGMACGSLAAAV